MSRAATDGARFLFDMSFEVGAGEAICLMGRNGMGKTTPSAPSWVSCLSGRVASSLRASLSVACRRQRVARQGLGLVPEGRQVFPNLTVHENLRVAAANRRDHADPWTVDRVYSLFPALPRTQQVLRKFAVGRGSRMLAIGRALMTNPRLLILDEATEGLARWFGTRSGVHNRAPRVGPIDHCHRQTYPAAVGHRGPVLRGGEGEGGLDGDPERVLREEQTVRAFLTV